MSGLNLYSFFKGVDDSNEEYRKQQEEERKKLEEFRAQEKLLMLQKDQEFQDTTRAQYLDDYARKNAARELGYQTSEEALNNFKNEDAQKARELARIAGVGDSINKSQVQIGANKFDSDNMPKILGQQVSQAEVALDERDARTAQGRLVVDTTNAITQALKNAPAFGDPKLRDLDANEFARLPTLKEKQDFLTRKGYGITANEDGSYKLGNSSLSFTEADVNLLITKPATAVKDILTSRIAATKDAERFALTVQATNNATKLASATASNKEADTVKKYADAEATKNANLPTTATTKAAAPPTPSGLSKNVVAPAPKTPLAGTIIPPSSGTPSQSFAPAATSTPAVNSQAIRGSNEAASDDVSNQINGMSLSELDVFRESLESSLQSGVQRQENLIIYNRIREINRVYGEKQGAENKAARDSESKSKEELAAKTLADKKAAEKLTQDAAKTRAEDFIAKALAKAKNK
jgi:hypothetical protein